MIVCGWRRGANVSENLFYGSLEECKEYCLKLEKSGFNDINICEDNGVISLRVMINGREAARPSGI